MPAYANDPRWIRVNYPTRCQKCGGTIARGSRGFYYPHGKVLLCGLDKCGGAASRDFEAARFDEEALAG